MARDASILHLCDWKLWGTVAVACALAGAVCLRVVFCELGLSVFMFY